ncbi:MAG: hypothetical protein SXU28_01430 [Pseudomonadota bacterium]|nr:hypothetical protein [Pseudomonadota bacterium]
MNRFTLLALPATFALAACSAPADDSTPPVEAASEQDAFFAALSTHCGKAYAGTLVSQDTADADFAGASMVMHVAECSEDRIAIPFHVQTDGAWDRSRTWVITRTADGLRLKHDHRHADGEPDAVTQYGGNTAAAGTARAQAFPVDAYSIDLFKREGLDASITNVWTVEVDPDTPAGDDASEAGVFAYQLQRTVAGGAPEDRFFRVEFDLGEEVEAPPPAWGHGDGTHD